jgi:hypothetical protein
MTSVTKDNKMADRYRHKVRGTTYRVLYEAAKASSIISALDEMTMVVYQSEEDGLVWIRPASEFFDGRFELVGHAQGALGDCTQAEIRNGIIEECAHAAFKAYGSITSDQYVLEGPAGLARRMINSIKALSLPSTHRGDET